MNSSTRLAADERKGFFHALLGNGCPLLTFVGLMLVLCGGFALFLSATHRFLPHDIEFLGMTAGELCGFYDCRVNHFMFHDRTAFGGALIAIGTLYVWAAEFPLRHGRAWAWWLFAISGALGFGSFLAYLGYGYLDSWHGAATLFLLPIYLVGLIKSFFHLQGPRHIKSIFKPVTTFSPMSLTAVGRVCLLATATGMILGGLVITGVGMTSVFVPEDLIYMNLTVNDLHRINPRLVPLIAHDRAGFGGGLATTGVLLFICGWYAPPTRAFHHAVIGAGVAGFGCAIGIHFVEGYVNPWHLAPAFAGAVLFATSILCELSGSRQMRRGRLLEPVAVEQSDLDPLHDWRPNTPMEPTAPEARRARRGSSRVR
jgi:hypothetical protein